MLTGSNYCVMSRIDVNGLIQRESDVVIIKCGICGWIVDSDWGLSKSRNKFMDVSYSDRGGSWVTRSVCIPEG